MSLLNIIMSLGGGDGGGIPPPLAETTWIAAGTIDNDGNYNGFPMVADAVAGTAYGIEKKSATHAGSGPLTLVKTVDGGRTWTKANIKVDGTEITSSNHSFQRLASGRLLISYRTPEGTHFAYSDNNGATFTKTQTIAATADYITVQSPVKFLVMPSGAIRWIYYKVPLTSGLPNVVGTMESTDGGITFTNKSIIFSSTDVAGPDYTQWSIDETAICITHNTGIDATCKMIAIARVVVPDGGTYMRHFKSSDGGATWTFDTATDAGTLTDDHGNTLTSSGFARGLFYRHSTNAPVDIRLFNGVIYVLVGERRTDIGYRLMYVTATPDGAFRNKFDDWSVPTQVKAYQAYTTASSIDCGYPIAFIADSNLYVGEYDHSTLAPNTGVDKRCLTEFLKIIAS